MKNTSIILVICLFFSKTAISQCRFKTTRDRVIFSAVKYFADSINSSSAWSHLILLDTTQYFKNSGHIIVERDLQSLFADQNQLIRLISGFTETIKVEESLKSLQSCSKLKLTSSKLLDDILNDSNGWKNFYKVNHKSNGYFITSKPYVDNNYSIIYLENYCGNLCGSGYIFYLQFNKKLKKWIVMHSRQVWVS